MLTTQATNEADRLRLTLSAAGIFQRVLVRLGFTSKHGDFEWPVVFNTVKYYGPRDVGIIEVDVHRLPRRVRAAQLADESTLHELATAVGYPVYATNTRGLTYVVAFGQQHDNQVAMLPKIAYAAVWDPPARKGGYTVPLGVDAAGQAHWYSMLDLQNTLIGGQPGSGKSTILHAWIMALTSLPPEKLKLTVIDPKSEFWFWQGVPHLAHPVTDDIADMPAVIDSILRDAASRRQAIKGMSRDFVGYNAVCTERQLPLHVVIFDELAVFSLLDETKMLHEIARIAQAGRSLGIFFVFATQRPGHEISKMMGVLKAVTDTRIAGRTSTVDDSRIILTKNPAAFHLPKSCPGRIIARVGGQYITIQSYWVSEEMIKHVARQLGGLVFTSHDVLEPEERALVSYAVDKNHGKFTINALYAEFKDKGWSKGRITKLAQVWEVRGWLTKPTHATDARRVTAELLAITGLGNAGT